MILYIVIGIVSLIILSFLATKMKLQFDTRDLIAWSILVSLTTGTYMAWANNLEEFQLYAVILVVFFIFVVLLSYYGLIFKE